MTISEAAPALNVEEFAAAVLGRPLWRHQVELLRSPARYRCITAGRQSGKSTALSTEALYTASTRRNALVLIVSAGEVAARRLLSDAADIAQASALLRGSVLDETKGSLTLANGSKIISTPASSKQIRGWPVDLLILDEAGFIDQEIWRSAEPSIIARPGSRVILSSSPWGTVDHFFRSLWRRGMDSPDAAVQSWHWPSSISPLVDRKLLEQIREREPADYFAREYLAIWADAAGSYFGEEEIMNAVADYQMTPPSELPSVPPHEPGFLVSAGVDWGLARDSNAVALVGVVGQPLDGRARLFIPWLEGRSGWPFTKFIDHIVDMGSHYIIPVVASERNGVGEFPTAELRDRMRRAGRWTSVAPVWTDSKRKMSGFGRMKGLMQQGRLILPLHPPLLKELRALEFEQLPSGGLRIEVPERSGHDDLSMALLQAVSCVSTGMLYDRESPLGMPAESEYVISGAGVPVPRRPLPARDQLGAFRSPGGREKSDGW